MHALYMHVYICLLHIVYAYIRIIYVHITYVYIPLHTHHTYIHPKEIIRESKGTS